MRSPRSPSCVHTRTWLLLCSLVLTGCWESAFPGAVGFGAEARGGRGGDVYHVTSLADDGPGSLREGVASAAGPRTIVFETGGIIDLQSPLRIRASFLTIAGQTAEAGITLRGYPVEVVDAEHIVIRYLRFRPGDIHAAGLPGKPGNGNADLPGDAADALSVIGCDQVVVDHVSASWSMDETLSVTKSTNVTVQHSIISESLRNSFHPEGQHGRGSLVRGMGEQGYTFYRNLWAHHNRRSPALGGQQDAPPPGEPALGLDVDVVENVIYDWGLLPTHVLEDPHALRINLVGNVYLAGPSTLLQVPFINFEGTADEVRVYHRDNLLDRIVDGVRDLVPVEDVHFLGEVTFAAEPFAFARRRLPAFGSQDVLGRVLERAGASHARDAVDARIVAQVLDETGGSIDSQDEVGGWPVPPPAPAPPDDLDRDGMADDWERNHGLDPSDPEDRNGLRSWIPYTNLERYLAWSIRR